MENLIIDTDLGYDCDDAGALLLANLLRKEKLLKISAMTHCVNRAAGATAIRMINEACGNGDIPVGVAERYAIDPDRLYEEFYQKLRYCDGFSGFAFKPTFYRLLSAAFGVDETTKGDFVSAQKLLKETLSAAKDKSVCLLCIGQLNDLADLLQNYGDLARAKIKRVVAMCGNFSQEGDYYDDGETLWNGEFNVILDKRSAQKVFEEKGIETDVFDYYQGCDVRTGSGLGDLGDSNSSNVSGAGENGVAESAKSLVYKMYRLHGKGRECPSWDIAALLYATGLYDDLFEAGERGRVTITDGGKSVFEPCAGGNHRLIKIKQEKKEEMRRVINEWFARS